jgi:hypothetical protein
MPHRFDLGFDFSYPSAPPFNAFVGGIDSSGLICPSVVPSAT